MLNQDILSSANSQYYLKQLSNDSIIKQKVKNSFCYQRKYQIKRKFFFNNREQKIGPLKYQTVNKKHLNQAEKLNFSIENYILTSQSYLYQKKKHKKMITQEEQNKVIGGGCGSSKDVYNQQQINFRERNVDLDNEFQYNFDTFTNKINIDKQIESECQGVTQVDIINCLKQHEISICRDIIIYKPKVIELIDVYLIYALTGSSSKEILNQDGIKEIGFKLIKMKEYFEKESPDYPTCDLIFFLDLLGRFNSTIIGKDEQNKNILIQAVEFIKTVVKVGSGTLKTFEGSIKEEFDLNLKGVRSLLDKYQKSRTQQIFTYLLDIWVKKKDQFQDRILNLTLLEELKFYITIFNELCSQKDYESDLVLLTLIKIDHFMSLAIQDEENLITFSEELSLNCELIRVLIPMLIQKSDSKSFLDEMKSFLKFTVESHTYRFLTISILLKYNYIIKNTNDSEDYKEQIMEYISYKYLCEKDKSVKLAFETSKEFADHFNSKIEQELFKDRIIQLSNERNRVLKIFDLEKYEEKIENADDIERMIANTIIEKWERDVKRRQEYNIAQKDDVLLEVQDLYIEQSIKYIAGNKIIQPMQVLKQINEKNKSHQSQNALEEILNKFLLSSVQTNESTNVNISSTDEQNKCKILGILAEGGTGKSMLIKKLETHLIKIANSNFEKENYIPLLIKCNSLDPIKPSIEKYLQAQGVNQKQINSMKKSDRNKVILLDGYDEYTGEYFRVYSQLNLNEWKNTKVIVTSRMEKLELSDACLKFSLDDDNSLRDEASFCIVQLKEFTSENIVEYCKMYFRQYRTKEEKCDEQQCKVDLDVMNDCMKNSELEILLFLPINLYLFTRMIVQVKDKTEIQKIKESISDQIGIQEIFFSEQFKREANDFIQTQIKQKKKKEKNFEQLIINSFFEYFQSISMKMFLNKGKPNITNFLQIQKDQIKFKLSNQIENILSEKEKNILHEKMIHYENTKIITRQKEIKKDDANSQLNKSYIMEFKHKSLFEYFVARAMKYDFDNHGDNIYSLSIEILKEFNINKYSIMNAGHNQSEQQVLIKFYKMIKNEIESNQFYLTYHLQQIEQNSRYIQYIKKSTIKKNTEISQIDIGASNMLSVLFLSKFTYPKLDLRFCSFSKLYVSCQKSDLINFENCNLEYSYIKNLRINYDSCNTQFATFDTHQKIFDTSSIFTFNQVIWDKKNILYTIAESGFINAFKLVNQDIVLQKSKQLAQTPLRQILTIDNDTLLVSTQCSILLINSSSFNLLQSFKFKNDISCITLIKENILVSFQNGTIFQGSFQNGFKMMNIFGSDCAFNEQKQILLVHSKGRDFSLYNVEENFKFINTIQGHDLEINSVAFSADGKYLVTASSDKTCKIWNAEKDFELINIIKGHISSVNFVTFSADVKYLATSSSDQTCKIWNVEKGFELINTDLSHADNILSVAFSTDGKCLATGSLDKTCKIWNAEKSFEFINIIQGHDEVVNSVVFSADGKFLATGSSDKTCKIWNVQKGFQLVTTIQGHTSSVDSVAFSADGKYLATGSSDNTCKIWNVEKNFEIINTIQGHTDIIFSVAFSEDGKYLATGSWDNTCKIWNVEKGFEIFNTIQGHTNFITSVTFSVDGRYLATGSRDKTCKIWNAEKSFELIKTIEGHTSFVNSVAFSVDGKYLATGAWDSTCKIWNAEQDFEQIKIIQGHTSNVNSVVFSEDGKYLATGSRDNTCKIWNAEKSFELINTIEGHSSFVKSVYFSIDGKYLATGSPDKTCKIWNIEKGFELINTIQGHADQIFSVVYSADGKYLATCSLDNTCKIWNAEKGFELINTIQSNNYLNSVAFSTDGKYLAFGSKDKFCYIFNSEKGFQLIHTIQDHTLEIFSVAFSKDGKYLATGSRDQTCKIWNLEKDFELINTIEGHTSYIRSVTFSADSKYLATGGQDKLCKIWNVEKNFELTNTLKGHTSQLLTVTFSTNGKYLATGSFDKTCKIWNVQKDFELMNTIKGHEQEINSVAFSADDKYLATGSSDKSCKIWNVDKSFELINTIQGHTENICSVAFSLNKKYLATGSYDKNCKIWNVEKGFELINTIYSHSDIICSVSCSADEKYICVQQSNKSYSVYDLENLKIIISEQNNFEELKEKYQLGQNENNFEKMRIFENMFIL